MITKQSLGDFIGNYRQETNRPQPLYLTYPKRKCDRCQQHKTTIGSRKIKGHHTCADCLTKLNPQ